MKNRHLLYPLWIGAVAFAVSACGNKADKEGAASEPEKTKFEQSLVGKDTAAVKALVDRFFTFVKNKQTDEALLMLYRNDRTRDGTPEPLGNEDLSEVRAMLESVPVAGYAITDMKFSQYYSNEVQCKVIIREGRDGMPPVTTKMSFKPVSYLGNWVLCLTNTGYGDRSLRPSRR